MLRPLTDLPSGVIGFEAVGEVTTEDYRTVLRPAVEAAVDAGGKVRLVYVLGPEFTGYTVGAGWQDTKLGLQHLTAFERTAVVTDVEWVEHLVGGFAWMIPGDLRRFPVTELAAAARWASGEEPVAEQPVAEEPVVEEPAPAAPDEVATTVVIAPDAVPDAAADVATAPEAAAAAPEPVPEATTAETPVAPVAPAAAFGGQETITPRAPMAPGADMRPGMAQPTPPQPVAAPSVPAQWAPDPSGRHTHRWWDGNQWTGHVADNGVSSFDPV